MLTFWWYVGEMTDTVSNCWNVTGIPLGYELATRIWWLTSCDCPAALRLSDTHQPAKWQNQIKRHTQSHYCASPWRPWISRWILHWVPDVNWQGNNSRGIIPLHWKFPVHRCSDLGAKQNASKWVGGKIWFIKIRVQSQCREESKGFAF